VIYFLSCMNVHVDRCSFLLILHDKPSNHIRSKWHFDTLKGTKNSAGFARSKSTATAWVRQKLERVTSAVKLRSVANSQVAVREQIERCTGDMHKSIKAPGDVLITSNSHLKSTVSASSWPEERLLMMPLARQPGAGGSPATCHRVGAGRTAY
jgi:hypothetical protein